MTPDEAFALGYADARPLSQEAADRAAAILLPHWAAITAAREPQAA